MCGGVVNNQIKKGLLLSLRVKTIKIGEYMAKLQARTRLSRALFSSFSSVLVRRAIKVHVTTTLSLATLRNIHGNSTLMSGNFRARAIVILYVVR